jgi:hypothetical protein
MAHEKRYLAQKRQRRRRKAAKAKVKLYEQGKLKHGQLPALAKRFLSRKMRALRKDEYFGISSACGAARERRHKQKGRTVQSALSCFLSCPARTAPIQKLSSG